jgi:hypothetical protein
MAKQGLWANINRRKKLGISRPKSETTISKEAYSNMKEGFPKKKAKGERAMESKMISAGANLDKRKRVLTKSNTMLAKGGIAKGCGKVMSNRKKVTKVY